MDKIIIVLCEGAHDIAFLNRILLVNGFDEYSKKISGLKQPFQDRFKREFNNDRIGFITNYKIPSSIYSKDNKYIFFHNMNGDMKIKERKELVEMYKKIIESEFTDDFGIEYRFIYFLDADEKGVEKRIEEIELEIGISNLENGMIIKDSKFEYGCYIFHCKETKKGTLEDILIEIMGKNEENIFKNSKIFLENNKLNEDRQREFVCNSKTEEYIKSVKYKDKKSVISIAGQLQFSGVNNTVIIKDSDFIRKEDLLLNTHCIDIAKLFE